jgi:hypothetical protein
LEVLHKSFAGLEDGYSHHPSIDVTICDVVMGISVVIYGSTKQRLRFLFRVWDIKRQGYLDESQMKELLQQICENSPNLPDELESEAQEDKNEQRSERSISDVQVILHPELSREMATVSSTSMILDFDTQRDQQSTSTPSEKCDGGNEIDDATALEEDAPYDVEEHWKTLRELVGENLPQNITYEYFEIIASLEPRVIEYFEVVASSWQRSHARKINRKKKANTSQHQQSESRADDSEQKTDLKDPTESVFPKYFSTRNISNLSKKLFSLESLSATLLANQQHVTNPNVTPQQNLPSHGPSSNPPVPSPSPSPSPSSSPHISSHPSNDSTFKTSAIESLDENLSTPPLSPLPSLLLSPSTSSDVHITFSSPIVAKPLNPHGELDSDDFLLDSGLDPSLSDQISFRPLSPPHPPQRMALLSSGTHLRAPSSLDTPMSESAPSSNIPASIILLSSTKRSAVRTQNAPSRMNPSATMTVGKQSHPEKTSASNPASPAKASPDSLSQSLSFFKSFFSSSTPSHPPPPKSALSPRHSVAIPPSATSQNLPSACTLSPTSLLHSDLTSRSRRSLSHHEMSSSTDDSLAPAALSFTPVEFSKIVPYDFPCQHIYLWTSGPVFSSWKKRLVRVVCEEEKHVKYLEFFSFQSIEDSPVQSASSSHPRPVVQREEQDPSSSSSAQAQISTPCVRMELKCDNIVVCDASDLPRRAPVNVSFLFPFVMNGSSGLIGDLAPSSRIYFGTESEDLRLEWMASLRALCKS